MEPLKAKQLSDLSRMRQYRAQIQLDLHTGCPGDIREIVEVTNSMAYFAGPLKLIIVPVRPWYKTLGVHSVWLRHVVRGILRDRASVTVQGLSEASVFWGCTMVFSFAALLWGTR